MSIKNTNFQNFFKKMTNKCLLFENNVLELGEKLIPLHTAYTQSDGETGRKELEDSEKSPKTVENEES